MELSRKPEKCLKKNKLKPRGSGTNILNRIPWQN
jgi:hypothetical protein